MKRFIFLLLITFFTLFPSLIQAAIHTASSCSYADVLIAYNAASSGDTVAIPAGDCSWATTLTVAKGVDIIGAGSDVAGTNLTYNGASPLFNVTASDVCIAAMSFDMTVGDYKAISLVGTLTDIVIHHCEFTKGRNTIFTDGYILGVIYSNTFTNCGTTSSRGAIYLTGANNAEWIRAYTAGGIYAGTTNALFIEDNDFVVTNDYQNTTQDAQIYIQEAAMVVVRYNDFDFSACTTATWSGSILNNHGNMAYYVGSNYITASPIFEFYNNTYTSDHGTADIIGLRGGSCLIHDNSYTVNNAPGPRSIINLTEEEAWQTAFFSPLRTVWPAQDQVLNTFIWNEAYTGTAPTYGTVSSGYVTDVYILGNNSDIFISKDQEYFMHAPQSSGGYHYYTGTRYGGSQSHPTDGDPLALDNGDTAWSAAGANAYYPYNAYIYPHPLRGEEPIRGISMKGVKIE